ncbi:hypothetical protein ACIBG4_29620 [Nonomuraea sp. NPDC050383]|uniref:hypothetical protein n=2 Tax=Nonomuraea TaxID=83681 RepID=UPI0037B70CFC
MTLIEPCLACNPLKGSFIVKGMGRILLIAAAVLAALVLVGPLLGLAFTLLKWGLIIGVVAFGVMLVSKWTKRT